MKNGIACPKCNCTTQSVLETRRQEGSIRRRRQCAECKSAFITEERVALCSQPDAEQKQKERMFIRRKLSHVILELRSVQGLVDNYCTGTETEPPF